jgi:hypothetical protein
LEAVGKAWTAELIAHAARRRAILQAEHDARAR